MTLAVLLTVVDSRLLFALALDVDWGIEEPWPIRLFGSIECFTIQNKISIMSVSFLHHVD